MGFHPFPSHHCAFCVTILASDELTRLGNALKCIWALPYVVSEDQRGLVEVDACGIHHCIEVAGDPQDPQIKRTTKKSAVKKGTIVKVTWPALASPVDDPEIPDFYKVVAQFACLNLHTTFHLHLPDRKPVTFSASAKYWRKWRTNDPTSAHWYTPESFHNLVMAYRTNGQDGKSVRDFASEFDGLRGSQYQRKVIEQAKLAGRVLGDLNDAAITRLLAAMKAVTRPVQPQRLGVIGEEHFRKTLLALGISANSFEYKKKLGLEAGMPFVVEAAFGAKKRAHGRDVLFGLNFSPTFRIPFTASGRRDTAIMIGVFITICAAIFESRTPESILELAQPKSASTSPHGKEEAVTPSGHTIASRTRCLLKKKDSMR
jgi:hypothetical protein